MAPPSLSATHKPRKKRKPAENGSSIVTFARDAVPKPDGFARDRHPDFALAAFLWPARTGISQWVVLPLVLMIVGLFRWAVGFWGYSGFQSPPMHGDFEAQRHWMELTIHLPVSQWYYYDLEWWGLDYPPLTAYHSYILGKIGSLINPAWFALYTSRRLDDPMLKIYMRATVFISEYLIYIPAIVVFCQRLSTLQRVSRWESSIALVAILMQPATMLIDHAHFQYNTVMLGFFVASVSSLVVNKPLWACVFFVNALGYKQMALYYAPAMFGFLLGSCIYPRLDLIRFFSIALITLISFALLLSPFLFGIAYDRITGKPNPLFNPPALLSALGLDSTSAPYTILAQVAQMIHRVFPFARGLFEDKVANLWCALHTFHKLHRYSSTLVQRLSLAATFAAILPSTLAIGVRPRATLLPLATASCAWGFFLLSFQVHEKSVLLPLLPMTLLLAGPGGLQPANRSWVAFANILGCFTMFPLLKRDELRVPYFVLTLLWAWLMGVVEMLLGPVYDTHRPKQSVVFATRLLHGLFYIAMALWHFGEAYIPPPKGKPDLWVVINVLLGAAGFVICYLWCTTCLLVAVFPESNLLHPPADDERNVTKLAQKKRR